MKEITGLIIIHNDAQMLEKALDSVSDTVDRLIVVDGAYEWVAPFSELNGENPESSSDDLINILEKSRIPYKLFTGVWENESHKRLFSIEQCETEFALLIDSDEVFELDSTLISEFMNSGKAIAECYFPLYYNTDYVGINPNLGGPTRKSALLNLKSYSSQELVDSLFLLVPKNERIGGVTNQKRFDKSIGTIHHLSIFRYGKEAYRRARFYNLLSMRINKKLSIVSEDNFNDDKEFFNLINSLDEKHFSALDNFFKFHKISASFPVIKENQIIIQSKIVNESIREVISDCYNRMIDMHYTSLVDFKNKELYYFLNKPIFMDITKLLKLGKTLCFSSDNSLIVNMRYNLYFENNGERTLAEQGSCKDMQNCKVNISQKSGFDRAVIEVVFTGNGDVFNLKINF
ncbi:hypothetical protein [Winogradskyella sp.]|uniref:hypothetical protein n=1 Tax=Winogradskyella sp. TaxID=1883156 RepID=UPI003AA88520